jgi:hypothetical protein
VKYVAGYNQPGYLPESDPEEFDSWDEAWRYIIGEIKRAEDDAGDSGDEELAEDLAAFAEDVNLNTRDEPFADLGPDGYVYWVAEE